MTAAAALEGSEALSPESMDAAADAARALARYSSVPQVRLAVGVDNEPTDITLPADIFGQVVDLLTKIANGNAVSIVPLDAELTTQQAAHYLNVSRPHVIKLVENGDLPHRMVGTHRKLPAREVLAFRNRTQITQEAALRRVSLLEEELGLDLHEQLESSDSTKR